MSKKMKVVMLCSLLLNVMLIGAIIGDVSRRLSKFVWIRNQTSELTSQLSEDKRKLFYEVMNNVYVGSKDTFKQIRKARENAQSILIAPEFDDAAYQVEVDKLHKLRRIMKQRLADAAKELAHQFSREERIILADFFNNPPGPPSKNGDSKDLPCIIRVGPQ